MLMPEYGRNVQKMVEYLVTIDSREKRLQQAEIIIELMGTLNPHLKTIEDYKHKLWDHLFQMTEFKLDVDAPYPCPTPEMVFAKPEVLPYPQKRIRHRHLGHNLQEVLKYETGGYKVTFDTNPQGGNNNRNFKQRNNNNNNRNFKNNNQGGNRNNQQGGNSFRNEQGGNNFRNDQGGNNYNKNRKFKNKNK